MIQDISSSAAQGMAGAFSPRAIAGKDRAHCAEKGPDAMQDGVDITFPRETPCIPPSEGAGSLHDQPCLDSLDIAESFLSPPVRLALMPEKPDPAFCDMVNHAGGYKAFKREELRYDDPQGDAFLIRQIDAVPGNLVKALIDRIRTGKGTGSPLPPDLITGRQESVDIDALCHDFTKMIQDHKEITPTMGKEHTWSKQARKYNHFGFARRLGRFITGKGSLPAPLLGRSKLFLTLACGYTSQYIPTGNEKALEKKLMSSPDRSLGLMDVLRESYLLNKGDLYLTLLTAENLLSRDHNEEDRNSKPLQQKLQYIRSDSAPEGDNYAAWYHFMGIALYGLMRSEATAGTVALVEACGSYFLEGPDRQETNINKLGARFGHRLKEMMETESWKKPLTPDAEVPYMNLTEFPHSPRRPDHQAGNDKP